MYQQPKRSKEGYKYLFPDGHFYHLVLKVEDKLFISSCAYLETAIEAESIFDDWIKSVEKEKGYKIKFYGDSRYYGKLTPKDILYKIVKTEFKIQQINQDFEK